jgi:hypothetical protein
MQYFNLFLILDDGHPKYLGSAAGRTQGEASETVLLAKGYDLSYFNRRSRSYYGMELRHIPRNEVPEGTELVMVDLKKAG